MEDWPAWRLVLADPRVATLGELETSWSLDDLCRANAWLDMREAMERAARPPDKGE